SQPYLFKSSRTALGRRSNNYIGSPENGLPVSCGVRAQEDSHGLRIETIVVVVEELVEVTSAKKELIGPPRRERGVQDRTIVSVVEGSHLEVVGQIRAGCSQGRTAAQRCGLVSLTNDGVKRKVMFVGNLVIEASYAVVAVAKFGTGAKEVASCSRQAADYVPRPEAISTDGRRRCRTLRDPVGSQNVQSLIYPGI